MPEVWRICKEGNMAAKFTRTDEEWRAQLSELAYKVARKHGTERAFSHDDAPKVPGKFHCICCGRPLFSQEAKFDSGTGWPSFYQPLTPDSIGTHDDRSWFTRRTEVHCADCEAHLGHVFPDGPAPTGLRYCMNGVAMNFVADDQG